MDVIGFCYAFVIGLFVLCIYYFLGTIFNVHKSQVYCLIFHVSYPRIYICFFSSLPFLFNQLLSAKQLSKEETEPKMVSE